MASYKDYNPRKNDDFFTTETLWKQISKYIPKNKIVSMPFYSPYSKCNELLGRYIDNEIIYQDEDFFEYDRGEIVCDNPPFSNKKNILHKLVQRNKPFMLILPISTLCYKYFRELFKSTNDELQLLIPSKRPNYIFCNPNTGETILKNKSSPFDSFICCWKMKIEGTQIIFME